MKKIRMTSAALAALMCLTFLASCGKKEENTQTQTTPPAQETQTAGQTAAEDNSVDPSVKFDLAAGLTDKMYSRSLMSEGNIARLAAAMKKAQSGEEVTVGVIGGSITQGSLASSQDKCYASNFFRWWEEKFPGGNIKTVNAGIGGTDSYLGVHRADTQLLSYSPDVVIVEFSVNDTDMTMNKYSYDSLVRKILSADNDPAVILLFTTQDNGASLQDVHKEIGKAYDLPMISYHDAVFPEVDAGTLDWKDISPDNIHPNDAGHSLIGQILSRYLDGVYSEIDSVTEAPSAFTADSYTSDYYKNARSLGANDITPTSSEGFETVEKAFYDQFPGNWKTEGGGSMTFEVECQNFGVFYLRTVDGKSGKYEVYVDGQRKATLEGDFSGGWGTYGATKQVLLSKESAKHTIEIKPAEGSEDKGFAVLALMVS